MLVDSSGPTMLLEGLSEVTGRVLEIKEVLLSGARKADDSRCIVLNLL